jgi:hypothetical protein
MQSLGIFHARGWRRVGRCPLSAIAGVLSVNSAAAERRSRDQLSLEGTTMTISRRKLIAGTAFPAAGLATSTISFAAQGGAITIEIDNPEALKGLGVPTDPAG